LLLHIRIVARAERVSTIFSDILAPAAGVGC
jgi:hypothetical protein